MVEPARDIKYMGDVSLGRQPEQQGEPLKPVQKFQALPLPGINN